MEYYLRDSYKLDYIWEFNKSNLNKGLIDFSKIMLKNIKKCIFCLT